MGKAIIVISYIIMLSSFVITFVALGIHYREQIGLNFYGNVQKLNLLENREAYKDVTVNVNNVVANDVYSNMYGSTKVVDMVDTDVSTNVISLNGQNLTELFYDTMFMYCSTQYCNAPFGFCKTNLDIRTSDSSQSFCDCIENTGFVGAGCQTCQFTDDRICNGRGQMINTEGQSFCGNAAAFSHCQCNGNWGGKYCTECKLKNHDGFCNPITQCEIDSSDSSITPCGSRGKCINTPDGSFECQCHNHWQGKLCDYCPQKYSNGNCSTCALCDMQNPCVHGICMTDEHCTKTMCVNTLGEHWIGDNLATCDSPFRDGECKECLLSGAKICGPHAIASNVTQNCTGVTCTCENGWGGEYCEDMIGIDCSNNPTVCQNGGTCVQTASGSKCSCTDGWTGPDCSVCDTDYVELNGECKICRACMTQNGVCNGHGTCQVSDCKNIQSSQVCSCFEKWSDSHCGSCTMPFVQYGQTCSTVLSCSVFTTPCPAGTKCVTRQNIQSIEDVKCVDINTPSNAPFDSQKCVGFAVGQSCESCTAPAALDKNGQCTVCTKCDNVDCNGKGYPVNTDPNTCFSTDTCQCKCNSDFWDGDYCDQCDFPYKKTYMDDGTPMCNSCADCQPGMCKNGGICKLLPETKCQETQCVCPVGYNGKYCEFCDTEYCMTESGCIKCELTLNTVATTIQNDLKYCSRAGTWDPQTQSCTCFAGYTGEHCSECKQFFKGRRWPVCTVTSAFIGHNASDVTQNELMNLSPIRIVTVSTPPVVALLGRGSALYALLYQAVDTGNIILLQMEVFRFNDQSLADATQLLYPQYMKNQTLLPLELPFFTNQKTLKLEIFRNSICANQSFMCFVFLTSFDDSMTTTYFSSPPTSYTTLKI